MLKLSPYCLSKWNHISNLTIHISIFSYIHSQIQRSGLYRSKEKLGVIINLLSTVMFYAQGTLQDHRNSLMASWDHQYLPLTKCKYLLFLIKRPPQSLGQNERIVSIRRNPSKINIMFNNEQWYLTRMALVGLQKRGEAQISWVLMKRLTGYENWSVNCTYWPPALLPIWYSVKQGA